MFIGATIRILCEADNSLGSAVVNGLLAWAGFLGGCTMLFSGLPAAASALIEAEATDGVILSVASLVDLWYVTQTTKAVTDADLAELRQKMSTSPELSLRLVASLDRSELISCWSSWL
jgi:hypothetical protein